MLLSPRKHGLTSLFEGVRVVKAIRKIFVLDIVIAISL